MQYTIENERLIATFDTKGAECTRLYDKTTHVNYLWNGDERYWGRHAPVLFPIVGKLKENKYQYQGKIYELSGHGFARDKEFSLFRQSETMISFVLEADEATKRVYPFDFRLKITYTLSETTLTVAYQVDNLSESSPLYFSIGGHPAFNIPLQAGNFEDYRLTIKTEANSKRYYVAGVLIDEAQTEDAELPFHKKMTHDLFKNDALIYQTKGKTEVTLSNVVDDASITLHYQDIPYVGIWSPYPTKAPFICLEPWWGMADTTQSTQQLEEKKGIMCVKANDFWRNEYAITVNSVKE